MTHAVEKPKPLEVLTPEDSSSQAVAKPCYYCSKTCVGMSRVRDKKGRYAHKACRDAFEHPKKSRRARKRPSPDFLEELPDLTPAIYRTVAPCPTCNQPVHPRAVLCTACGTDLTTPLHAAPSPTQTVPLTTQGVLPARMLPFAWYLGIAAGAVLGATLWTVLASALGLSPRYADSLSASLIGAGLLILGCITHQHFAPRQAPSQRSSPSNNSGTP